MEICSAVRKTIIIGAIAEALVRVPSDRPATIAVDFDGCLFANRWPDIGAPNDELIEYLNTLVSRGEAELILWTCREGEQLGAALEACKAQGLKFIAVNDNSPRLIELWGTNPRKIGADIYIDDKGLRIAAVEEGNAE